MIYHPAHIELDGFLLLGWCKSVKPRRWTLVLVIGAWTMTIGFLIRIIWGVGDNVDSVPIYAIQNLVSITTPSDLVLLINAQWLF